MKSLIKFLILFFLPYLAFSQELKFNTLLELSRSKSTITSYEERYEGKKRFEALHNLLSEITIENERSSANSILKQKLDSTFGSYVNYPELQNKDYYYYDQNGKTITSFSKVWNDSAKMFLNSFKLDLTYDARGNQTVRITSEGAGLNWVNSTKTELNFSSDNKLTSVIYYNWNTVKKQWQQYYKDELSYDTKGNAILVQSYNWNVSKNLWEIAFKTELEYDSKGNLVLRIFYSWDNQWLLSGREESSFNAFNQELSFVSLLWDDINADWINFTKTTNEYNSMQLIINYTEFEWDDSAGQWVPTKKTDYSYDMNGNMTNAIYSELDRISQKWIFGLKEECNYNNQYAFDDLILPENPGLESSIYFHHMLTKVGYFEYNTGNWHNSDNIIYYYSGINITNTNRFSPTEIKLLPNPSKNYFALEMNDVSFPLDFRLYDLNGKEVITKKVKPREFISTSNLSKGIYTYRIILNSGSLSTGKLVIE
jgi:hypothetical protein